MGMTFAEKILAKSSGKSVVNPGEFVTATIDLAATHEAFAMAFKVLKEAGIQSVWNPDKIVNILDHWVPASTERAATMHKTIRQLIKELGIKNAYDVKSGICHQVFMEKGHILPGQLIVGADSHTTTYGALGAAGTGIGTTEMAYVLATGKLWFKVPETIKFVLKGKLGGMITSKDIILFIAGKYSSEIAQYKSIEFTGPVADAMSLSSRMTMSNMSVELGAKFGFFAVDDKTIEFLKPIVNGEIYPFSADTDAKYEAVYEVNVSEIEPQIALPFLVDNVKPISAIGEITINQALIGSCTNGRLEDLRVAAEILKKKTVHPDVRLLIVPASYEVYLAALKEGILETFIRAGGIILNSSCGPCFGAHMGLLAEGERCIASINRNFKGRMGSETAEVYLSSPQVVAASAITGKIMDPRGI